MPFHVCLLEPEIPQNTGNIARTCAATGTVLHLVRPLGFSLSDRYLKRAGLDYWADVEFHIHDSYQQFYEQRRGGRFFYLTTKAKHTYTDFQFLDGDSFVFGKETAGLPQELLQANQDRCLRIPMGTAVRSLNLANSVAIVLYEGLRQVGFFDLT